MTAYASAWLDTRPTARLARSDVRLILHLASSMLVSRGVRKVYLILILRFRSDMNALFNEDAVAAVCARRS